MSAVTSSNIFRTTALAPGQVFAAQAQRSVASSRQVCRAAHVSKVGVYLQVEAKRYEATARCGKVNSRVSTTPLVAALDVRITEAGARAY